MKKLFLLLILSTIGLVGFSQNVILEVKGKKWYKPTIGFGVDTIQSYIIQNKNGAGNAGMVIIVGTDTVFLQLDGSGNYFIKNQVGDITFLATGGDVISKENFTIGDGTAVDYILKFDGSANDGTITWDEDPGEFDISADINVTGDVESSSITVNGVTADSMITLDQATGNLANSTTTFDTLFSSVFQSNITTYSIMNGQVTAGGCITLVDDASITLPDATTQSLIVYVDDDDEWALAVIQADGTVALPHTVGSVTNSDTDTNLCIFDSGTGATIRNRLGSTKTICYETKYKQ